VAAIPSVKGSVYAVAVEDVGKLLSDGQITREGARRWLEDSDLAALDGDVNVAAWYDVRSYDRLTRLLCDVEGGGSTNHLREKGRRTARRLIEMGVYAQMEYLQRTQTAQRVDADERFEALGRDLRRLNTLSASILNFSSWHAEPDPDNPRRYRIIVSDAAAMPETLVWRIEGFMNEMAREQVGGDLWSWSRASLDRIVYRMKIDV